MLKNILKRIGRTKPVQTVALAFGLEVARARGTATISAVVIRKDGTREDLGVISRREDVDASAVLNA